MTLVNKIVYVISGYLNVPNENLLSSSVKLITSRDYQLTLVTVRPAPKIIIYENANSDRMY